MATPTLPGRELLDLSRRALLHEVVGLPRDEPAVIVELDDDVLGDPGLELATVPAVLIGVAGGRDLGAAGDLVDVVVDTVADARDLAGSVERRPLAAVSLATLLRTRVWRDVGAGLVAESTTYSMLQAGPEFAAWHARSDRPGPGDPGRVHVDAAGDRIVITLDRPARHNALDAAQLQSLVTALAGAVREVGDAPGTKVVLRGSGPSFCSGGDLAEFGSFADPVHAHAVRLTRSAGRLVAMIAAHVEVRLHGSCLGAGIEVPAFAGCVVADPAATIGLPELELGLVPGAGGTVSLPRRIGRHRTAWLALTGSRVDAPTALAWGLVDRVERQEA